MNKEALRKKIAQIMGVPVNKITDTTNFVTEFQAEKYEMGQVIDYIESELNILLTNKQTSRTYTIESIMNITV